MGAYSPADMQALERDYIVHRYWETHDKDSLLKQLAERVRAIGTRGDLTVPASVVDALPKLEIIACFGVGTDGINLDQARRKGVRVTNTPDVLNEEVADLALALMLAIARQIPQSDAFTRRGQWREGNYPLLTRMHGKRLGLIGMGRIGKAIAKRAESFGMPIAYHSRTPRKDVAYDYYASPVELARNVDFLVAIVPGGAATEKLVNTEVLSALGAKGYFINVARGSVVDEEALLDALEAGSIAGAALDVYLNEPNIDPRFFALQNAVLHPHGGSATVETRAAMGQLVRDNLAAHFVGKPLLTPVV
jgi:D-3-phosphoglycerate dehydrogenase